MFLVVITYLDVIFVKIKSIHIYPKHKQVHNRILREGKWLKNIHVYPLVLDKNNIYMKLNMYKNRKNKYK